MISVFLQNIKQATVQNIDAGQHHGAFSTVIVKDENNSEVKLLLPEGSAEFICNAINFAINKGKAK